MQAMMQGLNLCAAGTGSGLVKNCWYYSYLSDKDANLHLFVSSVSVKPSCVTILSIFSETSLYIVAPKVLTLEVKNNELLKRLCALSHRDIKSVGLNRKHYHHYKQLCVLKFLSGLPTGQLRSCDLGGREVQGIRVTGRTFAMSVVPKPPW